MLKLGNYKLKDKWCCEDNIGKDAPREIAVLRAGFCLRRGFWYFARSRSRKIQVNPRNPAKFTKTRKIPRNSVEILSNTCLYNIFETYFSYTGYLLAVNLQVYLGRVLELVSSEICLENNPGAEITTKSAVFYRLRLVKFAPKTPAKFPRNWPIFCP